MEAFFRNPELKSVVMKMAILHVILAIVIFFFVNNEIVSLNNKIIDQNTALFGHIISKYPQMEDDLAGYITRGAEKKEIASTAVLK